jgi:kynurenine formamidase
VSASRRELLRAFGVSVAGVAVAGCRVAGPQSAPSTAGTMAPSPSGAPRGPWRHVVDLSHTLSPDSPFIPVEGKTFPFRLAPIATVARDGVYANRWELTEHVGTHVDAPCHFIEGGRSIDQLSLETLIGPAAVISIEARAARDPDAVLTADEVRAWERDRGVTIPADAALFLHTGWEARWRQPGRFVNLDAGGTMHFPGFSAGALDLLLERGVAGIGIDTLSIDPGRDRTYPIHKRLFAADKWAIEVLASLDRIPPWGAFTVIAPVKVAGASGAPARVLAFW